MGESVIGGKEKKMFVVEMRDEEGLLYVFELL